LIIGVVAFEADPVMKKGPLLLKRALYFFRLCYNINQPASSFNGRFVHVVAGVVIFRGFMISPCN
jgi:hypothetical protein